MTELDDLKSKAAGCERCPLARSRRTVVFGEGDPAADLMLVGEGPGEEEDRQGRPFVGAAGQLLDKILAAAGISREEVFITNTVMCRPPRNRVPTPEETGACRPFLDEKIRLIQPKIIVVLGATASRVLLDDRVGITRMRGRTFERDGITYYPTFHPAALLRDPAKKRPVWEDFQRIRDHYRRLHPVGEVPAASSLPGSAPADGETAATRVRDI